MKGTVVVLILVVGFVNSAFLDTKSPHSGKNDWDDDDSMVIETTAAPVISTEAPVTHNEIPDDLKPEEQQRPKFISLIPAGTHQSGGPSKSDQEELKYLVDPPTTQSSNEGEQQDGDEPSTPASSEEASSGDEETTEKGPKLVHVQLGKIPLTFEMIPMREENQQLLGRQDTNPIAFFPPEQPIMEKDSPKEIDDAKEVSTTEIITGKAVPDLELLPQEPSRYMVPPSRESDGENIWRLFPNNANQRDLDSPQTTVNPLLERINDFLQKAKRQLDAETTTQSDDSLSTTDNMSTTPEPQTTTEESSDTEENVSTTDPLTPNSDIPEDSNGDLTPSSPAPIPEEPSDTDEMLTTSRGPTILYHRPYPVEESQPPPFPIGYTSPPITPPVTNELSTSSFRPSIPEESVDYNNQFNSYYYTNPASILRRRLIVPSYDIPSTSTTLPPPPSQNLYVPPQDSYWPSYDNTNNFRNNYYETPTNVYTSPPRYNNWNPNYNTGYNTNYNTGYNSNYNTNYNPYRTQQRRDGYGYYLRPQRQVYVPQSTIQPYGNSIYGVSSEEQYGNQLNDYSSLVGANYNPYLAQGNQYGMGYNQQQQQPRIPYRQPYSYPITSSNLVNDLMMYAPMYSHNQYRRAEPEYF